MQSGTARQEYQKKASNTTKKTTNFVANKTKISYTSSLKTRFPFQTDKVLRESLHMFDTQKDESMNNVIAYVAPKNKTMAHRTSLNNRI